jgi:hypothetical protein
MSSAPFMLNLTNPLLRRQNQVNFIDVVLIPWWRATTRIFPGLKICYKNLLSNRNYYDSNSDSVAPSPESMSSTVNSPAPPTGGQGGSQRSSVSPPGQQEKKQGEEYEEPQSARTDQQDQGQEEEEDGHGQDEEEQ